jgi:hypothetical protein
MEDKVTTIKVTMKTRDRINSIGFRRESYDTIINRLLDMYSKKVK